MSRPWLRTSNLPLAVSAALFALASCGQARNLGDGLYAEIETRHGEILLQLEFERAPLTVANFVGLAEGTIDYRGGSGPYYDGLTFHRVVENFMIQGGDPEGSGRGGPGYSFRDEIVPELRHDQPGTLSMANSGPDTNGSQFFITYGPTPHLDGRHAVFGRVVEGQQVVNAVVQGDQIEHVRIVRVGSDAEAFRPDQARFDELSQAAEVASDLNLQSLIEAAVPNAQQSASGLRFTITQPGTGTTKAATASEVTVHYVGKFLDGTVFDSSRARNEPAVFDPERVIPGFRESLLDMQVGEMRTVVIPPELGYGSTGSGPIPPNSYLIFEIELISFR